MVLVPAVQVRSTKEFEHCAGWTLVSLCGSGNDRYVCRERGREGGRGEGKIKGRDEVN